MHASKLTGVAEILLTAIAELRLPAFLPQSQRSKSLGVLRIFRIGIWLATTRTLVAALDFTRSCGILSSLRLVESVLGPVGGLGEVGDSRPLYPDRHLPAGL